jgi:ribulose-phosphate 3-epimerase
VFHVEAETPENISPAIDELRKLGKKAGLAISPHTPAEALYPYIGALDLVLVMTVEPGYGGQEFITATLPKISELRKTIDSRGLSCELEVDGGINPETAKLCINAGANVLVAGHDIFSAKDRKAHIAEFRAIPRL